MLNYVFSPHEVLTVLGTVLPSVNCIHITQTDAKCLGIIFHSIFRWGYYSSLYCTFIPLFLCLQLLLFVENRLMFFTDFWFFCQVVTFMLQFCMWVMATDLFLWFNFNLIFSVTFCLITLVLVMLVWVVFLVVIWLVCRAKREQNIELTASTPYYEPSLEVAQVDAIWNQHVFSAGTVSIFFVYFRLLIVSSFILLLI